jgi:hypothetical protein
MQTEVWAFCLMAYTITDNESNYVTVAIGLVLYKIVKYSKDHRLNFDNL